MSGCQTEERRRAEVSGCQTEERRRAEVLTCLGARWRSGDGERLTIFSHQEVKVAVGVGDAHFGLHLRPLERGVDLPRAVLSVL